MESSSHSPASHPAYSTHPAHPLLRNRLSLHDFHTAFQHVTDAVNTKSKSKACKEYLDRLQDHLSGRLLLWGSLPLEKRRELVVEVLPRIKRSVLEAKGTKDEPLRDQITKLITVENTGKELDFFIPDSRWGPTAFGHSAMIKQILDRPTTKTGGTFVWSTNALANLTKAELAIVHTKFAEGRYTAEEQLLIAMDEARNQWQYDQVHPVTRNPLLRHRPAFSGLTQDERTHASIFAMSFRHFFHSIAYGYTDKHNRELQPRILDPRLAQAWLWATTREFTVEEVASLLEADRNRLTSYLEDCLDGMFKVDMDPEKILKIALGPDEQPHHPQQHPHPGQSATLSMKSISHFHRRLNFRQAAYYGTTPGAFAEGRM